MVSVAGTGAAVLVGTSVHPGPMLTIISKGPQYNILRILRGKNCPMDVEEVQSHLLVPNDNLQGNIEELTSKRFIAQVSDSARWEITDDGTEVLRKLDEPTMSLHRRSFAHFTSGEIAELNRLLVKLRTPAS